MNVALSILKGVVEDLGDVLVAVVGVKEIEAPILGAHDERARGDGLGRVPHELGTDGVAVGGIQPLDAEVVVVNEAEVRNDLTGARLVVLHAAAKAVEGHRDNRITPCPTNGAVFGIVGNRPNTCLSLDERLVAIRIVLGREVVDRRVLVEVVGRVGLTLGGGTISNVIVDVSLVLAGGELVADVVTVGLRLVQSHHGTGFADFGTAAEQVVGVGVLRGDGAIDGVGHAGEKVARRLIIPFCGRAIGIGEAGLQVRAGQIFPRKIAHRGEPPRGGVVGEGVLACAIHAVAHVPAEGVVMAGEGLGIEARDLLGDELAVGVVSEGGDAGGVGGGGLTIECFVSIKQAFSHATPHLSSYSSTILLSIRINSLTFIVLSIIASLSKSNTS